MATERVKFARNFDYTFPNRAVIAYKAGWEGPVKAEIAAAARDKGVLDDAMPTTRADLEKLAASEGVDLGTVIGTGANGRVVNDDVAAAIMAKRAAKPAQGEPGAFIGGGDGPSGAEAPTE